jgi:hypothetical protein
MKTQQEVIEIVKNNNPKEFKKFGDFRFEVATEEQEVVTEINGEVETKNVAKVGDYILTGAAGEKYVLKPETFQKRYKVVVINNDRGNLEEIATATGTCFGNVYNDNPFTFMASWGEKMICISWRLLSDLLIQNSLKLIELKKSAFEKYL